MEDKIIGSRIKQRRKELHLTQIQIKEKTGISSGNLSDLENGNKLPSTKTLIELSNILDCSIDWILKGENHKREISLTENEKEMLQHFQKLSEREQIKVIGIVEERLKEYNEMEQQLSISKIG